MFSQLYRLSIRNRIRAIVAIFIGSIVLGSAMDSLMLREVLWREKEISTRQQVDSGASVLAHYHALQVKGELSEAAAKAAAIATIRAMRYNGSEYFWINDLERPVPSMVMHPTQPELDGHRLDAAQFDCATSLRSGNDGPFRATDGKLNLFTAFVEVIGQAGQGYVTYTWPKPAAGGGVSGQRYAKLSYVKQFAPWGWLIGSGIYVDDVDSAVRQHAGRTALMVFGAGAALLLLATLLGRSITGPLDRMVATMRAIGDGDLSQRLALGGGSELAELASGFNDMLSHVQGRDAELARHRASLEATIARRTTELQQSNEQLEMELAERRLAEHAMRESRARMHALLDASGESVLLLDPDGRVLAINAFAATRFSQTPETVMGRNFFDFMPPELAGSRRAAVRQVALTGEPLHTHDQRGAIFFDNHIYPVKDEFGAVESVAIYAKDVTQQQHAQRVDDIFRHLDTVLLKWRINLESIAQMFCDDILPAFDLVGAWIGQTEKDGRIALRASAEVAGSGLLDQLREHGLRWAGAPPCCAPAADVIRHGQRRVIELDDADAACGMAARAIGARAVLILPLALRDQTWGVLTLYGRAPRQFNEPELAARLDAVAARLGVSLESASQQEWLSLLDTALAAVDNAVLITDADAAILWANRSFSDLSGYSSEEVLGKTPKMFSSGVQDGDFYRRFWSAIRSGATWRGEIVNARRDGSHYTVNQTVTPLLNSNGQISHYVAILEDISARKLAEERIAYAASHDLLTGLPNRGAFFDRLEQALALTRRDGLGGALLFLDLDRFKQVNDQLGHAAGDSLLIAVAQRLRAQVRASDTVARLAGDEFTVILPHLAQQNDAAAIADKILAAIAQPLSIAGTELNIGISIGIALFPQHGATVEDILNASDNAMYAAKKAGRHGYAFAADADTSTSASGDTDAIAEGVAA